MSEKHLVCQGAVCQCIFGTALDTLKVKTQKKHFINDLEGEEKLIATDQDLGKTLENNTFGSCAKLNNNPCQAMITEWSGFYDKVTLEANGGHPIMGRVPNWRCETFRTQILFYYRQLARF